MKNKREKIITACSIIIACIGIGATAGSFAAGRAIASALQAGRTAVLADGVSAQGQLGDAASLGITPEDEAEQDVASGDGTQQESVSAGDANAADNAALEAFSQAVSGGDAANMRTLR